MRLPCVDWLDALHSAITNDTEFTKPRDPHQCEFGKWYDNFETNDEELKSILADFDEPHKKIHSLADQLLSLKENGETTSCLEIMENERATTLKYLIKLFNRARDQIQASTKSVDIYLTIDGVIPCTALRIDEIADVEIVSDENFTPLADIAIPVDTANINYLTGVQRLNGDRDCLMVDVNLLLESPMVRSKQQKLA